MIDKVVKKVMEVFPETKTATFFAVENKLVNDPPPGMDTDQIRTVL
jgi:hypothetical protein